MRKYIVILVNIVGNGENHPYVTSYSSDLIKFDKFNDAANHGYKLIHSDDFLIGVIHKDKLISLRGDSRKTIIYSEKDISDIKEQLYIK